jgi:hypothetical protein
MRFSTRQDADGLVDRNPLAARKGAALGAH